MTGFLDFLRNPAFADLLMAGGQGLIAAGSGDQNAFARMPLMFGQLQQQRASDQRQAQADARDQQLFDMKVKEMERAEEERARQKAFVDSMLAPGMTAPMTGGTNPAQRGANAGAQPTMPTTGKGAWTDILTPDQITAIRGMDPTSAIALMGERAFAEPEKFTPDLETIINGDYEETGYWDQDGNWRKMGSGPRWQPQQPKDAPEMWEAYTDPKTGRTGQKSTKSGKVDWDPGQTGGMSIDLNGDGIPEFTTGTPSKPPTEAQGQAAFRGSVVAQAIDELEKITKDTNISPLRSALADAADEKGPIGRYAGGMIRSEDEKKFNASVNRAVEGLVAAMTGAGVAKDQFGRVMTWVPSATDLQNPELVEWKLAKMRENAELLMRIAGPLGKSAAAAPGGAPDLKSKYGLE